MSICTKLGIIKRTNERACGAIGSASGWQSEGYGFDPRQVHIMLKQAHLFIKGDVIGVGFRAWTKIQAKPLDVTGWIRNVFNRPDLFGKSGGVETVLQGEEDEIDSIIKLIKNGPPVSRVDDVEVMFEDPREIFDIFEIRRSESY